MQIDYFSIEGAPGRYFQCPSGMGVLSDKSCGESYKIAWRPESIACGRRFHCRNCAIGQLHSGEPIGKESRFFGKVMCCRCERTANRLIHSAICVSCYNRERELKIGKNARGTAPRLLRPLRRFRLLVSAENTVSVRQFDAVLSAKEAIFRCARNNDERPLFGWCGHAVESV